MSPPRVAFWEDIGKKPQDIVLLPTLHPRGKGAELLALIDGIEHYEERQFYFLLLLRHAQTRICLITTRPLDEAILRFWGERLLQISPNDGQPGALSAKILARPRVVERVKRMTRSGQTALQIVNSTGREEVLAEELEMPLLAVSESLLKWGTKSGSRTIFERAGIPHAQGTPKVHSVLALAEEIASLYEQMEKRMELRPVDGEGKRILPKRFVVKLDDGFSGEGNAILDVSFLQSASFPGPKWKSEPLRSKHALRIQVIQKQFEVMRFQGGSTTWAEFKEGIIETGALAEVFLEGAGARSPSGQAVIDSDGTVHMLSTHEQILGGADGQCYLGGHFPCDATYRKQIQDYTILVGKSLAKTGVLGNFSLDLYARQMPDSSWNLNALEINVRPGGTTHPLMTLKFLTGGHYDLGSGNFIASGNTPKYYVASDNVARAEYKGLTPDDVIDMFKNHPLHWNPRTQTGAVFHMLGSLSVFGKVGVTCIADSESAASELYTKVVEVLDAAVGVGIARSKL